MKKLVLFTTLLCTSALFGQMSPTKVRYSFKVAEITDEASAKNLQTDLRKYFDVLPQFSDSDDVFSVSSNVLISEEQLGERLTAKGLHLAFFERKEAEEVLNTKH